MSRGTADVVDLFRQEDADRLGGTVRMGDDRRASVVAADCRSWDVPNLFVCGSALPMAGGINPSLTIRAIALRMADRIERLAAHGDI